MCGDGNPTLPLQVLNPSSKAVITIETISSDRWKEFYALPGLLDSNVKIVIKYYTDDGTTKSTREVTIGIYTMNNYRHHEIMDGAGTIIV